MEPGGGSPRAPDPGGGCPCAPDPGGGCRPFAPDPGGVIPSAPRDPEDRLFCAPDPENPGVRMLVTLKVEPGGRPFDPGGKEMEKERISFDAQNIKMINLNFMYFMI